MANAHTLLNIVDEFKDQLTDGVYKQMLERLAKLHIQVENDETEYPYKVKYIQPDFIFTQYENASGNDSCNSKLDVNVIEKIIMLNKKKADHLISRIDKCADASEFFFVPCKTITINDIIPPRNDDCDACDDDDECDCSKVHDTYPLIKSSIRFHIKNDTIYVLSVTRI